jgi:hypothetical protein
LRKKRGVVLQATWDAANQMDDYTGPHNQRNGADTGFHLSPCRFILKTTITLPRQARDKYRESSTQKEISLIRFSQAILTTGSVRKRHFRAIYI